jgi:TldD protein
MMREFAKNSHCFLELRYHKRIANSFLVQKGRVDVASHTQVAGIGVRAYVNGFWGFSATSDLTREALARAVDEAIKCATLLGSSLAPRQLPRLQPELMATQDYVGPGVDELLAMPIDAKLGHIIASEQELARSSSLIHTARCRYNEIIEEKIIVTSDGADAALKVALPELTLSAIAEKNGQQISAQKGAGVAGGWQCLFNHPCLEDHIHATSKLAIDLLDAKYPARGKKTAILDPAVVGLLCHEAIGHTVEADFVKSGSIAKDKIGATIASPLVTMYDSGSADVCGYATGTFPFDDEGVITKTATIIKEGVLSSYLHNRQSAEEFGVAPTGNARAWSYKDEPLIRMRNTYLAPGSRKLEEMIEEIDDGYLVEGAGSGQADSNGEFMFGCSHVWHIKKGKKRALLREATLSGIAFDVLKSVDAVSEEFRWDLGTGSCGKGQPAKVDAGGPFIRCKIHFGGR